METIFLGCFLFGAMFTLVTALLGAIGGAAELGSGGPGGIDAAGVELPSFKGAPAVKGVPMVKGAPVLKGAPDGVPMLKGMDAAAHPLMHMLNTSSILAFLTWFGGAGYLALKFWHLSLLLAIVIAIPVGLAGGGLIAFVLAKIREGERYRTAEEDRLDGTLAKVAVSIPENGVGEIVFTKGGTRRGEAARGPVGTAIPEGAEVLIIGFEKGFAIVEPWNKLVGRAESVVPPASEELRRLESQQLKEE